MLSSHILLEQSKRARNSQEYRFFFGAANCINPWRDISEPQSEMWYSTGNGCFVEKGAELVAIDVHTVRYALSCRGTLSSFEKDIAGEGN